MSLLTPSDIQYSAATQIWGCYRLVSRASLSFVFMIICGSYTYVLTVSEPGRVFWGADEEISDGGSPRVIILGYDGLPMQPDEDEREPMFIQLHDPDYVPEPIYPEYIPLEDEHEFPVEEQPLPPVDSPTAESPGYVAESDPKEDPEEYDNDESDPEDGPVDYPMDGGKDGDDDDGYSSGDDADNEDEEEEEEEHLAPTDFAVIVPTVEPASMSLPPEAEVERLLAMPTPPPSPPISLSPPSAGERLARIASTQALVDAVTAVLPSPLLPPLPPSLYIPPPVDRRNDLPESELPPRKKLCLSALGSREVGYGIRDTWVDPAEAVPEITPMTLGGEGRTRISQRVTIDSQRVDLLMEDMIAHQETILIVEEEAYASREAWAHAIGLNTSTAVEYPYSDTTPEQQRRARQPGPDVRVPDHQDASRDAGSHI
ncbi:hypothetical protein Tco_1030731 [Tanacetum coccineum]|uniref:Uncharacterized protein n=1 Tax=Tanacetum coccineum TaxID=301880 RepID=A0ABQ5G8H2_9ASTR